MATISSDHPLSMVFKRSSKFHRGYFAAVNDYTLEDEEAISNIVDFTLKDCLKLIVSKSFVEKAVELKKELLSRIHNIKETERSFAFAAGEEGYALRVESTPGDVTTFDVEIFRKSITEDFEWYFSGFFWAEEDGLEYDDNNRKDLERWLNGEFKERPESNDSILPILIFLLMEFGESYAEEVEPSNSKAKVNRKEKGDPCEWTPLTTPNPSFDNPKSNRYD